jgi:hypothetical protein
MYFGDARDGSAPGVVPQVKRHWISPPERKWTDQRLVLQSPQRILLKE